MAQVQEVDERAQDEEFAEFAVVAEDTWKLYGKKEQNSTTKINMNFGGFEWNCTVVNHEMVTLIRHSENDNADVKFEIIVCGHKRLDTTIHPVRNGKVRVSFRKDHDVGECIILTIRMLKRRSAMPDFTSEHVKIGHLESNHTLRIGDQTFYVNKELLSMHSRYFDRMFNGDFVEAKKARTELATECADPTLFHDFLSFMVCPGGCRALPNRTNVVGLMQLARFYQVDFLAETCERFLENCYKMPPYERIMAAKKLGLNALKTRILNTLSTMEAWKELALKFAESED